MMLAFYRGPGNWITRFIRYWTDSEYSHVTLVFSNGEAFGASGRDRPACQFKWLFDFGVPGRHRVLIRRTITYQAVDSADLWTLVPINVTPAQERRVRRACERWDGTKFDWLGLACHLLPRRKKRKPVTRTAQVIEMVPRRKRKRIYCSNLAITLLQEELGRGFRVDQGLNPGQLHAAFAPAVHVEPARLAA